MLPMIHHSCNLEVWALAQIAKMGKLLTCDTQKVLYEYNKDLILVSFEKVIIKWLTLK